MNRILLVGGNKEAFALADSLSSKGYKITIINKDKTVCDKFAKKEGIEVIYGDGTTFRSLESADTGGCAISIALTDDDAENLVISELCKKKYGVKKTVALLSDPKKTNFFKKMGVDCAVCAINAITAVIEQNAIIDKMSNFMPIGNGMVSIVQTEIEENSPVIDKKLWEINFPAEVVIGCILRGEVTIIPRGDTRIIKGDTLIIIAASSKVKAAENVLTGNGND